MNSLYKMTVEKAVLMLKDLILITIAAYTDKVLAFLAVGVVVRETK